MKSSSDLRRALREADARLFEQQQRHQVARDPIIDLLPPSAPVPRERAMTAAALCVAAGLALIGTGEFMHRRQAPVAAARNAPLVVTQAPVSDEPRAEPQRPAVSPGRGIIIVHDAPPVNPQASGPEPQRISVKRTTRPAAAVRKNVSSRGIDESKGSRVDRAQDRPQRGVLDRLRLGWLRAFAPRSAL
jgi:hypothetical protein